MGYRANYMVLKGRSKVLFTGTNEACFSSHNQMYKSKNKILVFILTKYGCYDNEVLLKEEDIKLYLKEINRMGFKNRYLGIKQVTDYFPANKAFPNSYGNVAKRKIRQSAADSKDMYVVEVKVKDYNSAKSLLGGLTAIRYLYEKPYNAFAVDYLYLVKSKTPRIQRMSRVTKFQLAHFLHGRRGIYLGGHTCLKDNSLFVTTTEFKELMNDKHLDQATDLFYKLDENYRDIVRRTVINDIDIEDKNQRIIKIYNIIK